MNSSNKNRLDGRFNDSSAALELVTAVGWEWGREWGDASAPFHQQDRMLLG
jgi:hypothetical protein